MGEKAKELSGRLAAFNDKVIDFVENIPDDRWAGKCEAEDWSVGVTARHIGVGHYRIIDVARMIIAGETLPEFSWEKIIEMGNVHASKHVDCTRDEALAILTENGAEMIAFVSALGDHELDCSGKIKAFGGEVKVSDLLEAVVLQSAGEHLSSIQAAVRGAD